MSLKTKGLKSLSKKIKIQKPLDFNYDWREQNLHLKNNRYDLYANLNTTMTKDNYGTLLDDSIDEEF